MGTFVETAKGTMINAERTNCVFISLHDDDPSTTGANEISGGSPAYVRKACVFNAYAATESALNADVTLNVPACTVKYVGYWTLETDGVFQGSDPVENEIFAAQGEYKVLADGTTLSI